MVNLFLPIGFDQVIYSKKGCVYLVSEHYTTTIREVFAKAPLHSRNWEKVSKYLTNQINSLFFNNLFSSGRKICKKRHFIYYWH